MRNSKKVITRQTVKISTDGIITATTDNSRKAYDKHLLNQNNTGLSGCFIIFPIFRTAFDREPVVVFIHILFIMYCNKEEHFL